MSDYFTKIPNVLFYGFNGVDDDSILKHIKDDKVLSVLDYLHTNTNRKGITIFTIEDIILSSSYQLKKGVNGTNNQIKNILKELMQLDVISSITDSLGVMQDVDNIKINKLYSCTYKLNLDSGFHILHDSEKDKILNQSIDKADNHKVLLYYCYLKSRIYNPSSELPINARGGKAAVCYPSFKTISLETNINENLIPKYNDILVKLDLIRIANAGLYYFKADPKKFRYESNNIYVLYDDAEYWKDELKESIKQYKRLFSDEREFVNTRQYKNNDKKINGYIARIEALEKQGKATEQQIEKKNQLLYAKEIDEDTANRMYTIISLLDKYPNKLVSYAFADKFREKLADEYWDLEYKLGLIDRDSNILVDWNYYKWIMTNYEESKHEYYNNCVKKHIRDNSPVQEETWGEDDKSTELDSDDMDFDEDNPFESKIKRVKVKPVTNKESNEDYFSKYLEEDMDDLFGV